MSMTPPPRQPYRTPGLAPGLPVDHWPTASARTGEEPGAPSLVRALAVAADGAPLAVAATERGTVRVWHTGTGEPLGRPFADDGGTGSVALARVAGRPVVATASGEEGTVRLWDVLDGRPLGGPLTDTGPSAPALAAAQGADGRPLLVAGCLDGTTRVWDLADTAAGGAVLAAGGPPIAVATALAPDGRPFAVTTTPDDQAEDSGTVELWDLSAPRRGGAPPRRMGEPLGRGAEVHTAALAFLDGDPVVVTAGWDKAVRLWDPATARPLGAPLTATDGARALAVTHLGGRPVAVTASTAAPGAVRLWDLATHRPLAPAPVLPDPRPIRAFAVSPSGGLLAATGPYAIPLTTTL
nr:WD40 repeat domain-containing protein [Streptomyces lichenis]